MAPSLAFRTWATDNPPPSHSVPIAVAGKVAASLGAWDRFHLAAMAAYFAENRTITDRDVILDIAEACDLDAEVFAERLDRDGPSYEAEVWADHRAALEQAITGVPTVLVNDQLPIPGAQDLMTYRQVVTKIWERQR